MPSGSERRHVLTMATLLSEKPIHGIGHKRFNAQERQELDALLGRFGFSNDNSLLANLHGSEVADIADYVRNPTAAGLAHMEALLDRTTLSERTA